MYQLSMHSPVGDLTLTEEDGQIIALDWGWAPDDFGLIRETALLVKARGQLDAYFDGDLQNFDLPLAPDGTPHQKEVWRVMSAIPYGRTRTYGELAAELGSGSRAVANACGRNCIPIIIPCHRVVAAGGKLGGYSGDGGVETKKQLLNIEALL
ncbi:MAG: methylated-DNA--[protein]-cysteine S-methyltransferase [Rhodospirillales bacterium]